ncbi:glycosyltransferase [Pseudomonas sp. EA_105y_Pfl2_R69]|uniref:glycosyltransferase n=1 Tax=Pseudomonas sp. EA_105y_Pfl2_R69 TaxID=3088683 RepID=UPI0030D89C5C
MIILVGSKIDQASIQGSLGKPEYSYFFLMKDFLPALERLGTVLLVKSTDEIERLSEQYRAAGEEVVFLSFSPPHQVPLGLSCPTVVVFAWEFDTLPSVAWDDNPQNDWRYTLANLQGAICTSQETASLVKQATAEDFPVISLPAPVWDRYKSLGSAGGLPVELGDRVFPFAGIVIDSPLLGLSADGLVRKPSEVPAEPEPEPEPEPELPPPSGALTQAWQLSKALFNGWLEEISRPLQLASQIAPTTETSTPAVAPADNAAPAAPPLHQVNVSGVVYTTVLNPADSRKNWVELITAFCWVFKEREDATLVVKMTHHDLEYYRIVLITLLSRLAPFSCRVIVLHGFLEDEQYRELIKASTYYVNASSGEGLCLPLMEFLSAGKPGIAPVHSAMSDYVDEHLAFLLKCSLEPFCWPHDPTGVFMTHRHRLNWHSLVKAYQDSYQVAQAGPEHYRNMSQHAFKKMQAFASVDVVTTPLDTFLRALIHDRNSETLVQREEGMLP